jgi:hypothetical protein
MKNLLRQKICLHGCYVFEWLLFLLEYKVAFVKFGGH